MGLELEEIAMEVENHFGITIPDKDGIKIRTPHQRQIKGLGLTIGC